MAARRWIGSTVGIGGLVLCIAVPSAGQRVTNRNAANEWGDFGKLTIQNAPLYIRDASNLVKVQYLAMKVNDEVIRLGIRPNDSSLDRLRTLSEDGTCGDLTNKMISALTGSKLVDPDDMGYVKGQAVAANKIGDPANWDHGTIVAFIDGRPFAFDLWMYAHENGGLLAGASAFNGFAGSKWNGMPADDWGAEMKKKGYDVFTLVPSTGPPASFFATLTELREKGEFKRVAGQVTIEDLSAAGPGDIKTFRAFVKNPPNFVAPPFSAVWTLDGQPVSVLDSNNSTVLTIRSLTPGTHTVAAKLSFMNSSTGRREAWSAQRVFSIATSVTGQILDSPKVEVVGSVKRTYVTARVAYTDSDGAGTTKAQLIKQEVVDGLGRGDVTWILGSAGYASDSRYEGYRRAKWKRYGEGVRKGTFSFDVGSNMSVALPAECKAAAGSDGTRHLKGIVWIIGSERIDVCGQIDSVAGRAWGVAIGLPEFTWEIIWGPGGPK